MPTMAEVIAERKRKAEEARKKRERKKKEKESQASSDDGSDFDPSKLRVSRKLLTEIVSDRVANGDATEDEKHLFRYAIKIPNPELKRGLTPTGLSTYRRVVNLINKHLPEILVERTERPVK